MVWTNEAQTRHSGLNKQGTVVWTNKTHWSEQIRHKQDTVVWTNKAQWSEQTRHTGLNKQGTLVWTNNATWTHRSEQTIPCGLQKWLDRHDHKHHCKQPVSIHTVILNKSLVIDKTDLLHVCSLSYSFNTLLYRTLAHPQCTDYLGRSMFPGLLLCTQPDTVSERHCNAWPLSSFSSPAKKSKLTARPWSSGLSSLHCNASRPSSYLPSSDSVRSTTTVALPLDSLRLLRLQHTPPRWQQMNKENFIYNFKSSSQHQTPEPLFSEEITHKWLEKQGHHYWRVHQHPRCQKKGILQNCMIFILISFNKNNNTQVPSSFFSFFKILKQLCFKTRGK